MMHLLAWILIAGSVAGLLITLEGATGMFRWFRAWYHTRHAPASSASRETETDDEENKDE